LSSRVAVVVVPVLAVALVRAALELEQVFL
jgi:hypothetical protein